MPDACKSEVSVKRTFVDVISGMLVDFVLVVLEVVDVEVVLTEVVVLTDVVFTVVGLVVAGTVPDEHKGPRHVMVMVLSF